MLYLSEAIIEMRYIYSIFFVISKAHLFSVLVFSETFLTS
jgi:hypothetical protein